MVSLEELFEKPSPIFKHEERLLIDYVPQHLPNREKQLEMLARMFKPIVTNPGAISQRVILLGPVGTGKTVVAKKFGAELEKYCKKRDINLRYVHVNCYKDRSLFLVMRRTVEKLNLTIPQRGYSSQEMINILKNKLNENNMYLLLTLDEVDYLIRNTGSDVVYTLSRLSDEHINEEQRVSFIFIMRDREVLFSLEPSARSSLMHNIILFKPYRAKEIYDILEQRVYEEEAIYSEALGEGVLETISELVGVDTGGKGDARLALEILWRAGKYAESQGKKRIEVEDVRKAFSDATPTIDFEIKGLKLHEALILLAIIRKLKAKRSRFVRIGEVEAVYQLICEQLGVKPRGHTKVWEYVKSLSNMGIISTRVSAKGLRGRSTLIEMPSLPLDKLEKELLREVQEKLAQKE